MYLQKWSDTTAKDRKRRRILVDVGRGGEVRGVAADVDVVRVLVHADVVDLHRCGERQVVEVDETEVGRHAQVGNEILKATAENLARTTPPDVLTTHHRLLGDRTRPDLNDGVRGETSLLEGPCELAIRDPADVLSRHVNQQPRENQLVDETLTAPSKPGWYWIP